MKHDSARPARSLLRLVVALALVLSPNMAQSQTVARVSARERVTEKRSGEAGNWLSANVGAGLNQDDRFRTRKRSKADLLFTDKSLIRLGQLSTLYIQTVTEAKLTAGQLLFSRLTPGRIVAGAGIAGIRGSVGVITLNEDGSALFSLIKGAMDVTTIRGDRVDLLPGQSVLVLADGSLSALRVAAPLVSGGGGGGGIDLSQAPVDSPFAGSTTNLNIRSSPGRLASDQGSTAGNPVIAQNPTPFQQAALLPGGGVLPGTPPVVIPPVPGGPLPLTQRRALAGGSTPQVIMPDVTQAGAGLDLAGAHILDAMNGPRRTGITDIEIIGALGDGGTQSYGGRVHTYLAKGPWSLDVALLPLKLRFNSPTGRTTRDISAVSSASLSYANPRGEIQIGRQRFLSGPTQAALFGSLVRQGARDAMDAVRVAPNIGKGRRLDLAYLYDAFPRNLPYRVPGAQKGFYGRFGLQRPRGNYGLNLLHYSKLPVPTSLGVSADFAFPLVPGQVEVYSEVGLDPFRRRINTVGLTFPGLYDRSDFDIYLESASLSKGSSIAPAPPTEYSLRVYRRLNKNSNLVAQFQRFHRSQTSVTVGFSFGAHILSRGE